MIKNYLTLFWISLIGTIVFSLILIFLIVFCKKIITARKYGLIVLFFLSLIILAISLSTFSCCLKDYKYYYTGTYMEFTGTVIDFMDVHRDYDGNGELTYSKPKFLIEETNEVIVLNAKNVALGEKYTVKYFPNTKICEITKHLKSLS